jgi:hypothetical protein
MFINICGVRQQLLNPDDDYALGNNLAINKHYAIFVENDLQRLIIITRPFSSDSETNILSYKDSKLNGSIVYVYKIVLRAIQNDTYPTFAIIAEDTNHKLHLVVFRTNQWGYSNNFELWRPLDVVYEWKRLALGMDPYGTRVYVVMFGETLCLDISSNTSVMYNNGILWDQHGFIFPEAIVVTEDHSLFLLAHRVTDQELYMPHFYSTNLSDLSIPVSTPATMIKLSTLVLSEHFLEDQKQYTMLSMALNEESNMIIVGIPYLDMITIISIQEKSKPPIIIKTHVSSQKGVLFGKSVLMLDNNTYAVLAHSIPTLPWSLSQVQVSLLNESMNHNFCSVRFSSFSRECT